MVWPWRWTNRRSDSEGIVDTTRSRPPPATRTATHGDLNTRTTAGAATAAAAAPTGSTPSVPTPGDATEFFLGSHAQTRPPSSSRQVDGGHNRGRSGAPLNGNTHAAPSTESADQSADRPLSPTHNPSRGNTPPWRVDGGFEKWEDAKDYVESWAKVEGFIANVRTTRKVRVHANMPRRIRSDSNVLGRSDLAY
jgi:hypothetical protein